MCPPSSRIASISICGPNFACSGPPLRSRPDASLLPAPTLPIENLYFDRSLDSRSSSHKRSKPNNPPSRCGLVHRTVYSIPRRTGSLCSPRFGAAKPSKPFSVAVLPNTSSESHQYLEKLGLDIQSVSDVSLPAIHVKATPTIVLLDRVGRVENIWVGKLSTKGENEIIDIIRNFGH